MEHDDFIKTRLESVMFHIARDFAAFGSLVCFCTTLAVWGEVLFSA
jgi:diacylglycerol kinase